MNHSASIKLPFYTHRRHQLVIFSLYPASHGPRKAKVSRDAIKNQSLETATQWQALLGPNGINTRADLARYLRISRARVTPVLQHVTGKQCNIIIS